jgi:hypothetical protein
VYGTQVARSYFRATDPADFHAETDRLPLGFT